MAKKYYPILGNGEAYGQPISQRGHQVKEKFPYEYDVAKERVRADLEQLIATFEDQDITDEVFTEEKVVCFRMSVGYEAKSYYPSSLLSEREGLKCVGGRVYKNTDGEEAKLYFCKTNTESIRGLIDKLDIPPSESFQKAIKRLYSIDVLTADEKIMGFTDQWEKGTVEVVLHPVLNAKASIARIIDSVAEEDKRIAEYSNGITFISMVADQSMVSELSKFNVLRSIHPIGNIIYNSSFQEDVEYQPIVPEVKSPIVVGVFDTPAENLHPAVEKFVTPVNYEDRVTYHFSTDSDRNHGGEVCGALLFGSVSVTENILPEPPVTVKCFGTFHGEQSMQLYDTIDLIEEAVRANPEILLYSLSCGPEEPIINDEVSRFTYVLDSLTNEAVGEKPLFCVAAGNWGEREIDDLRRIQAPSDIANGISVGAYAFDEDDNEIPAEYSCIGPGREGCKIKPDVLEFGGNEESRFGTLNGNKGGAYCERQGTSFACPNLVRKIGKMMLLSEQVTPQLARALIIHKAQRRLEVEDERMIGNGLLLQDAEDILQCTDKAVDFYYQGKIRAGSSLHVPIFVPNLNGYNGNVQITWTIVTVSSTNIGDCSAYTNNCLLETFYPNKYKYRFSKWVDGNEKTVIIDTSSAIGQSEATRLQREGYKISTMPVSKPPKMFHTEKELKKQDLKWDTVVKYSTTMRGSSLKDPAVVLQSIGREDGENEDLAYYMVVTVSIPKYPGDLYLDTCAQYQLLESIQIRNTAEIMVPVN